MSTPESAAFNAMIVNDAVYVGFGVYMSDFLAAQN